MRADSELEMKSRPHEHGMKVGAFQQSCCPICLERYTTENPAVLFRCEHSFHFQCIDDWWQRSNKCPVCDRTMKRRHAREGGAPATPPRGAGSESSGEEDIFPVSQGMRQRPPAPAVGGELGEGDVMTDDEVMQFFSAEELDRLSRHPVLARHAQSRGLVQADLLRELLARRGAAAVGGQRRRSSPIQRSMDRRRQRRESADGTPTSDHPLTPITPSSPSSNQLDTRPPPPPHTTNTNHERIRLTSGATGGSDDGDMNAPHFNDTTHHRAHCCCCSALHLIGRGASYVIGSLTTGGDAATNGQPQSTLRSTLGLRSAIGVAMPPSPNGSSPTSSPVVPVPPTKVLS